MITGIWRFLHALYSAKHIFISLSQEPHKGHYYVTIPFYYVRKLRLRDLGRFVSSHIPNSHRADILKRVEVPQRPV